LQGGAAAADQQDCIVKNAREKDACALAWHPKQRVLAIAWKDGESVHPLAPIFFAMLTVTDNL
jgi:hypothetical protein